MSNAHVIQIDILSAANVAGFNEATRAAQELATATQLVSQAAQGASAVDAAQAKAAEAVAIAQKAQAEASRALAAQQAATLAATAKLTAAQEAATKAAEAKAAAEEARQKEAQEREAKRLSIEQEAARAATAKSDAQRQAAEALAAEAHAALAAMNATKRKAIADLESAKTALRAAQDNYKQCNSMEALVGLSEEAAKAVREKALADLEAAEAANAAAEESNEAADATSEGMEEVDESTGDAGRALMQLGQAADDAQYGFQGIMNNIPGILESLGVGPGLVGVVTMAMTAVYQLSTHLGLLGEEMDEVGKIIVQTSPDEARINANKAWAEGIVEVARAFEQQKKAIQDAAQAQKEKNAYDAQMRELARREQELITGRPPSAAEVEVKATADFKGRENDRVTERTEAEKQADLAEATAQKAAAEAAAQKQKTLGFAGALERDKEIQQLRDELDKAEEHQYATLGYNGGSAEDIAKERAAAAKWVEDTEKRLAQKEQEQKGKVGVEVYKAFTDDDKKNQAIIDEARQDQQDKLEKLEADAKLRRQEAADARKNVATVHTTTGDAQAVDLWDTNLTIAQAKKEEEQKRRAYEMAMEARKQPKAIVDSALGGIDGLVQEARKAQDTDGFKRFQALLKELRTSEGGLTPDLIVKINAALVARKKTQPHDNAATAQVSSSIDAARKYDEAVRTAPPPQAPNLEGVTPEPSANEVQVPGTFAAQEQMATIANQAEKYGNKKGAQGIREVSQSFSDGASQSEVEGLRKQIDLLSKSKDEGVATIARSLADFANAAAAKVNSMSAELARTKQAEEAMKLRQ